MDPTENIAQLPPAQPQDLKKVLIIEDDEALADIYAAQLQIEGFDTQRISNGEMALETAKTYQPDLILMDVMMPKVSGFDVLGLLRSDPDTANLKVILLTALDQPADRERAESLGATDYLVKSQVVIAEVIERIKHHLSV